MCSVMWCDVVWCDVIQSENFFKIILSLFKLKLCTRSQKAIMISLSLS
jgi:hypothetical protein